MVVIFPDNSFETPVLYFDGTCIMCNSFFKWVIRKDKRKLFRFATLQSEPGQQLNKKHSVHTNADTVLLKVGDEVFSYSTAALKTLILLGGVYKYLGYAGLIVPKIVRDKVYRFIAKNRYKWFGNQECMIPDKEIKHRFL